MTTPAAHEQPTPAFTLLASLGKVKGNFVVVSAQYSPDPSKAERMLIFSRRGAHLRKLSDAWLTRAGVEELVAGLTSRAEVALGGCDAMYATSPKYIWAATSDELKLWRKRFLVGTFSRKQCRVRTSIFHPWRVAASEKVRSVYSFLSPTWSKHGVILEQALRPNILVAQTKEWAALLDPTYDGINLMCDAAWAVELGKAIAEATDRPLRLHPDLK
jgi:hypothetical protein